MRDPSQDKDIGNAGDERTAAARLRMPSKSTLFTLLLVFICFTLTSTSYLAWLYRLLDFTGSGTADAITMVGGYSFQALGIGIACSLAKSRAPFKGQMAFIAAISLHLAYAAVAIYGSSMTSVIAFGYAMSLTCGIVASFYLLQLVQCVPAHVRGTVFGCGYACSVVVTWLLATLQGGNTLGASESLIACAALSLAAIGLAALWPNVECNTAEAPRPLVPADRRIAEAPALQDGGMTASGTIAIPKSELAQTAAGVPSTFEGTPTSAAAGKLADILVLAGLTVLLLSLVKNIGFSFPSSDLVGGVSLESSRLLYAVGLLIAGIVADRSRKYAALCCLAALVVPFACLALANEPIPGTIMWAVDYLFYGFFSVYRVVLFADLAESSGRPHLSGFGLMFGRIGDALGTAICLSLTGSTAALVVVAAVLFAATTFTFYRLFLQLYIPAAEPPRQRSESEIFDEFVSRYGITVREREVLRLVLAERTNAEAATELFVAESTVKFHVRNMLKKTGCKNRLELMQKYAQEARQ